MNSKAVKTIAVVYGTRPELIKLFPVIQELRARPDRFATTTICTAQHRELLDELHRDLQMPPDIDLDVMKAGQSLTEITTGILGRLDPVLAALQPDCVVVQGDTTSVLAAALAAFYRRIPVAHVEAGLRSFRRYSPFPEEMNRTLTASLASYHYAPTDTARQNLLRENVADNCIRVTGNTAVDALLRALHDDTYQMPAELEPLLLWQGRTVLLTAHRRENWGGPLEAICAAAAELLAARADLQIIWPVHPNPQVRAPAQQALGRLPRAHLIAPPPYHAFARLMRKADLILSDSGGIQEEAPSLGKKVLVLREVTDRPESVQYGLAEIVGTDRLKISARAAALLWENSARTDEFVNPYGDGQAARRIVEHLIETVS